MCFGLELEQDWLKSCPSGSLLCHQHRVCESSWGALVTTARVVGGGGRFGLETQCCLETGHWACQISLTFTSFV